MLNPFLLAGLVFAGIGLVQEAITGDDKTKPKAIVGPAGKSGAPGKPGLTGKTGAPGKDGKDAKSKPIVDKVSDG